MATARLDRLVFHLRHLTARDELRSLGDGELLARFVHQGEQAAFEALVIRHGPMVLGTCSRVVRNGHDAEDAFQTVFLVLARRGHDLLGRGSIGNWLYGVARHTALKAREKAMRRRRKESQVAPPPDGSPDAGLDWQEVRAVLDEELSLLPEKYREAVVLCDLSGHSRKDAARRLGVAEGTLSSRLATAREKLAERLRRRGVAPSAGAPGLMRTQGVVLAGVPAALVASTVRAAAAGAALAGGVVSASVASLTQGVLNTMTMTKSLAPAWATLALALLVGGAATSRLVPAADPEPAVKKKEDLRVIAGLNGKDSLTLKGSYKKVVFEGINGEATVDCAADFQADEIYVESVNGNAKVTLKLRDKARLKTLTVARVNGEGVLDATGLEAGQILIKELNGGARVSLRASGDVSVEQINGSAGLTVSGCRNFTVKEPVKGSATVAVTYSGEAKVTSGGRGVTLRLDKAALEK